jgi:TM2 domain-containing membrane protein YozV
MPAEVSGGPMDSVYDFFFRSSVKYWRQPTLNYTVYWALAVFLGFTGLDYLYLGSPLMFVSKAILNIFTLGFLWFYDALNATFNTDQVKLAGPFIPGFGPLGIGGGRFADEDRPGPSNPEEAAKATNFLYYGLGLMTLGFFGVDSFMSGDKLSGFLRLIAIFTFIYIPVAFIWYVYNLYRYFVRTGDCLDANWNYFGAPEPKEGAQCPNVLQTFTVWALETTLTVIEYIPVVNVAAPVLKRLIEDLKTAYGIVKTVAAQAMEIGGKVIEGAGQIKKMQETLTQPPSAQEFAEAKTQLGRAATDAVAGAAQATPNFGKGLTASVPTGLGALGVMASQKGGGVLPSIPPLSVDSSVLGLVAGGLVLTILVSSVTLTFWRAYQNVRRQESASAAPARQRAGEENDDGPPDPAAFGGDAE